MSVDLQSAACLVGDHQTSKHFPLVNCHSDICDMGSSLSSVSSVFSPVSHDPEIHLLGAVV